MTKKKDENYYKKLYKKLKKEKFDPVLELKKAIAWYQMLIITLLKTKFKGEVILTRQDIQAVAPEENLVEDFDKNKNIVLKTVKIKKKK